MLRVFTQSLKVVTIAALSVVVLATGVWAFSYAAELARPSDADEYFLDNETNAAQADFLARSQLYEGDYREADRFVQELLNVTPEAVQRVARKYMKGIRFAYVGDPSKLDPRTIALF